MTKEHTYTNECGFDSSASLTEDRYVCLCGWRTNYAGLRIDNNAVPFEGHTVIANDRSDPHTSEGGTLKPCPFCGDDKPDLFDGVASCRKLGCCIGGYRMLVDDWNRRSAPAAGMVSQHNRAWSKAALVMDGIANGEAAKLLIGHYGFRSDEAWAKALRKEFQQLLTAAREAK